MKEYHRVYADVDLDAIYRNVSQLVSLLEASSQIMAVIKADGYGHGAVAVAKTIDSLVYGYAVATIEEAINLRKNSIDKPILILGYTSPRDYERLLEYNVTATVFGYDMAKQLSDVALSVNKSAKCHIKIDTGMRRIGFYTDDDSLECIRNIVNLPGICAEGIFTHFASADDCDKTIAMKQLDEFESFVKRLENCGVTFRFKHCANSAAIIDMPMASMDLARAGIAIYGMYPSDLVNKRRVMLFPAISLKSFVVMVKDVAPGEGISYSATFVTDRVTRVATVSVGYGDGYPRSLSSKGYVLINGKQARILGRVCMDQMMVDVTDIEDVSEGTLVTLVGRDGNECITVEEISQLAGSFNYEFVCDLGKRIPKRYYKDGKLVATKDYFDDIFEM